MEILAKTAPITKRKRPRSGRSAASRGQRDANGATRLSQTLREARSAVEPMDVDDERQVAEVLISASEELAVVGLLSLNREFGMVRLDLRLGALRDISASQATALLELNGRTRFSWVYWDPEHGIAWLRGAAMCGGAETEAIRALGHELSRTLRDHAIVRLLLNGRNGERPRPGGAP